MDTYLTESVESEPARWNSFDKGMVVAAVLGWGGSILLAALGSHDASFYDTALVAGTLGSAGVVGSAVAKEILD